MQKTFLISFISIAALMAVTPTYAAADTLKIGFVTDWEYHKNSSGNKLSSKATDYLEEVVDDINDKDPHMVIGGGDYVESTGMKSSEVKKYLKEINGIFKKVDAKKRYYLLGNHDLRSLEHSQAKKYLGINYSHKAVDYRGFRVITLDTNFKENGKHRSDESYVEGYVPRSERNWLEARINESRYPVIIFSHHSPARPNGRRDLKGGDTVREIIEKSGKVVAVVSGHNPTQTMEESNGVRYFVVNNLTNKKARKTYAIINATNTNGNVTFSLKQYGKIERDYSFKKNITNL